MGRRGKRRRYYWDGLQFPATNVPVANNVHVLVGTTAQEFMPGTVVRVRGSLCLMSTDSSATEVGMKLMYVEFNDAQTMSGDHLPIDTHEEDIAARQLWTYYTTIRGSTAGQPDDIRQIDLDVRSKVRLVPSGKMSLVLLSSATTTSRASISGYVRVCVLMDG